MSVRTLTVIALRELNSGIRSRSKPWTLFARLPVGRPIEVEVIERRDHTHHRPSYTLKLPRDSGLAGRVEALERRVAALERGTP